MKVDFKWNAPPSVLARAVEQYGDRVFVAIRAVAGRTAQAMQDSARNDATWTDRTGNARSGLFSLVEEASREVVVLYLSHGHTIEYGKFLELAHGGKYAIIMPTIQKIMPQIVRDLKGIFR